MTDLEAETSPAWAALSKSGRRVYAVIAAAISDGNGTDVAMTYLDIEACGVSTASLSTTLRTLEYLGWIERRQGRHLITVYSLSNRWQHVSEAEAARLTAVAREVRSAEATGWRRIAQRLDPGCEPDDASPQPNRRH